MSGAWRTALVAVVLLAGAAALRFHRLGRWSLASDELATFREVEALFEGTGERGSPYWVLPRLIPVGYVPLRWCHVWFGDSEWASRLAPAALGSLTVALCYLLLAPSVGAWGAFFTAALVGLLPDHIYQSQYHRFYATAGLLGWTSLALGGWAVARRSTGLTLAATALGLAAVAAHAVWAAALGGMWVALIAARFKYVAQPSLAAKTPGHPGAGVPQGDRRAVSPAMVLMGFGSVAAAGIWAVVIRRQAAALNEGAAWGYSPTQSALAVVSQLSWPVALLAVVGLVWGFRAHSGPVRYWVVLAMVSGAAILGLPAVMVYQPHYGLLLGLPLVVAAGVGAEAVRRGLVGRSPHPQMRTPSAAHLRMRTPDGCAAWAWVGAVVLLPMPGLVSYYADGSRYDYRAAAEHLRAEMRPGDRVACDTPGVLRHYLRGEGDVIALPPAGRASRLEALAAEGGRTWVVLASGRRGLDPAVERWLWRRARQTRHIEAPRLDYYRFCVDVFLIEGAAPGGTIGASP